jgi:hypothetical protein
VRLLGACVILRNYWYLFEILQYVKKRPDEFAMLKILRICFCSCHSVAVHFSANRCHSVNIGLSNNGVSLFSKNVTAVDVLYGCIPGYLSVSEEYSIYKMFHKLNRFIHLMYI